MTTSTASQPGFAQSLGPATGVNGLSAFARSGERNPVSDPSVSSSVSSYTENLMVSENAMTGVEPEDRQRRGDLDVSSGLRIPASCARMPVALTVGVPLKQFRVRHLLAIFPGDVIETQWDPGEDLPLSSGDVQLAWSEFEVIDAKLAIRVTRLA